MILFQKLLPCLSLLAGLAHGQNVKPTLRRDLPEKVLVGYATQCDETVPKAVREGVNVVVWAFFNLTPQHDSLTKLDLECIRAMMQDLDQEGFTDTVHLVSMGGWNGPHLDPYFQSSSHLYRAWKAMVGDLFHGMDVDWEGNSYLPSHWNTFSKEEMDILGNVMALAKHDGYIVSITPPQSYLDIHSSKFSRQVNLTDPDRTWHADFSYFGQNVYAYWLAKYGDSIDLVMVQFYESYSRAAMEVFDQDNTPENYLQQYVWDLHGKGKNQFWVDFESDPELGLDSQFVTLPLSKLVWGFCNHCQKQDSSQHLFVAPECVQAAYQGLWDWMLTPRGLMFWVIGEEGQDNDIDYAKGLNDVLHIRDNGQEEHVHAGHLNLRAEVSPE